MREVPCTSFFSDTTGLGCCCPSPLWQGGKVAPMSTLIVVCRHCAESPRANCGNCRWLNTLAAEAEERIEYLLASATIIDLPDDPGPLAWIMAEHQVCAR